MMELFAYVGAYLLAMVLSVIWLWPKSKGFQTSLSAREILCGFFLVVVVFGFVVVVLYQ